jgi:hypothetical protein
VGVIRTVETVNRASSPVTINSDRVFHSWAEPFKCFQYWPRTLIEACCTLSTQLLLSPDRPAVRTASHHSVSLILPDFSALFAARAANEHRAGASVCIRSTSAHWHTYCNRDGATVWPAMHYLPSIHRKAVFSRRFSMYPFAGHQQTGDECREETPNLGARCCGCYRGVRPVHSHRDRAAAPRCRTCGPNRDPC